MSDLTMGEQATVYTPQAGDVVVLEVSTTILPSQMEAVKQQAERAFGRDVKIVVLAGAHFAGVVRD